MFIQTKIATGLIRGLNMPKKRTVRKRVRRKVVKRVIKKKLAGFTKVKGKYALVFKKGRTRSIGKGRFKTKKTLQQGAKRFL